MMDGAEFIALILFGSPLVAIVALIVIADIQAHRWFKQRERDDEIKLTNK